MDAGWSPSQPLLLQVCLNFHVSPFSIYPLLCNHQMNKWPHFIFLFLLLVAENADRIIGRLLGTLSSALGILLFPVLVSRLLYLRKLTLWDSFFPMEFVSVLRYLKPLVTEVYELGLELKVPVHCLETMSSDFPSDTSRRRRELVRVWMSSSLDPPCWWHLVRALRSELVGRKDLATNIKTDFSKLHLIERSMCVIILVNLSL